MEVLKVFEEGALCVRTAANPRLGCCACSVIFPWEERCVGMSWFSCSVGRKTVLKLSTGCPMDAEENLLAILKFDSSCMRMLCPAPWRPLEE